VLVACSTANLISVYLLLVIFTTCSQATAAVVQEIKNVLQWRYFTF